MHQFLIAVSNLVAAASILAVGLGTFPSSFAGDPGTQNPFPCENPGCGPFSPQAGKCGSCVTAFNIYGACVDDLRCHNCNNGWPAICPYPGSTANPLDSGWRCQRDNTSSTGCSCSNDPNSGATSCPPARRSKKK